jgi:hypothetical protein
VRLQRLHQSAEAAAAKADGTQQTLKPLGGTIAMRRGAKDSCRKLVLDHRNLKTRSRNKPWKVTKNGGKVTKDMSAP